ncbi:sarcolemmal membrane-associated protein-like isoform X2 [Dysidea avara]|uniref:sarcolemmal membrane-associated protein-like isoform X2 n=1 Tax=Dysidea avara TaxID=196820 RepID=UPI00331C80F3
MSGSVDVPKAVLVPHGKSHPFTQRECILKEPAKVGRSLVKTKIQQNNFIFDCRVLSRNHALIWYQDNKFFIQDTKSSNGTFVNERRLSPTGEESRPMELKSGDVIQFGVNVEGPTKVTHGCIIAIIKLSINGQDYVGPSTHSLPQLTIQDPNESISELVRILETAFLREQDLENKLVHMHDVITKANVVAKENLLAVVKEDHLLARMRMLENQIQAYSQDLSEDNLKVKLAEAYEEREKFEIKSKNTIQGIIEEKGALNSQYESIKQEYDKAEQECSHYKSLYEDSRQEHLLEVGKLNEQLKVLERQCQDLEAKLKEEKDMASDTTKSLQMEVATSKDKLTKTEANLEELQKEYESLKIERDELTTSLSQATLKITQGTLHIEEGDDDEDDKYIPSPPRFPSPPGFGSFSHQETIIPGSLSDSSFGELLVGKVKLEEEVALYKEKIDKALGMIAKLLANLAIVNACCKHEEEEVRKRGIEIQQLKKLLEEREEWIAAAKQKASEEVATSHYSPKHTEPSNMDVSFNSQAEKVESVKQPNNSSPGGTEVPVPLTTVAVLISIGVVIGAVIVGYFF